MTILAFVGQYRFSPQTQLWLRIDLWTTRFPYQLQHCSWHICTYRTNKFGAVPTLFLYMFHNLWRRWFDVGASSLNRPWGARVICIHWPIMWWIQRPYIINVIQCDRVIVGSMSNIQLNLVLVIRRVNNYSSEGNRSIDPLGLKATTHRRARPVWMCKLVLILLPACSLPICFLSVGALMEDDILLIDSVNHWTIAMCRALGL